MRWPWQRHEPPTLDEIYVRLAGWRKRSEMLSQIVNQSTSLPVYVLNQAADAAETVGRLEERIRQLERAP